MSSWIRYEPSAQPAGPRRRSKTGLDSLTETERRVARLVREGLTNAEIAERLFISRRTVDTHLSHIFVKLGISSRRELTNFDLGSSQPA